MKNSLLIGFFTDNDLIREAYNAMRHELSLLGYSMEGIQPEGKVSSGYEFPAYSFKESLSGKYFSKIRKASCLLQYSLPFSVGKSYSEMQTQGADRHDLLNCINLLIEFRIHLEKVLTTRKIKFVILNHQFSGFHLTARDVCRRLGTPFVFWHPGFLPGTMSFDRDGQMAESEINAIINRELPSCGAEEEELGKRYRTWFLNQSYVRPGKSLVSNTMILDELKVITSRADFKNVLLVIGSNDYRTGMLPRSYRNSSVHSKVVYSSKELYRLVVENTGEDTLVIYKPHPNVCLPVAGLQWDSTRSLRLFGVTIKDLLPLATATVTLCSGGAYESMLFGLPTAIFGEVPGSRTGICYTMNLQKPDFSNTLQQTLSQEEKNEIKLTRLNILIGFLLKKYFFANGTSACPFVGRTMGDAMARVVPM